MAGNSTKNFTQICFSDYTQYFITANLYENKWQVNGLMLSNAILMGLVVCIGAYAPRYRRHPLIAFLLLAATTLFLPIVSIVASNIGGQKTAIRRVSKATVYARCTSLHYVLALVWTGLVLSIGVTTSAVVAGDSREGRTIAPPTEQLVKTIWAGYLTLPTIIYASNQFGTYLIFLQLFLIMFTKLLFKYSAFFKARRSTALGRSPRLIAGYMAQLQLDESQNTPPALVVMGEDTAKTEERPHGYCFKGMPKLDQQGDRLVTLDRVWGLDDMLLKSEPKDVCFSFTLFKLLRCRFAKYTVLESGFMKIHKFFGDTFLQGNDYERVFQVIADELSLIHYYYYSSLPISYSCHLLLPIFSIALSLYTIGYCLFLMVFISQQLMQGLYHQIFCQVHCISSHYSDSLIYLPDLRSERMKIPYNSATYYTDVVPAYLVLAALILAETRDIIFYVCSNWTKVALICNYINRASWQRSPAVQKYIAFVFKHCRCKLAGDNWGDKMNQCTILVLHQSKFPRLPHLNWKKNTKIPRAVKASIFEALKRKDDLTTGPEGKLKAIRPPSSLASTTWAAETGDNSLSAPDGKRTAYTILVWHIATTVFEIRCQPQPSDPEDHTIAATHLSRYCAYLVAYCPELLPSDDEWCKKLYKDVKKNINQVLKAARRSELQQLFELLSAEANHEVLKYGTLLGMKLARNETGWEELARFWSEILYIAPSENLEAHADAIARGGELITILWALLAHAGVVCRIDATDEATTSSEC